MDDQSCPYFLEDVLWVLLGCLIKFIEYLRYLLAIHFEYPCDLIAMEMDVKSTGKSLLIIVVLVA